MSCFRVHKPPQSADEWVAKCRAVTPDFGAMAEKQYYLEGAFRRMHVRLRTHAESVAFFGGGEREGRTVSAAFNSLQVNFSVSLGRTQ